MKSIIQSWRLDMEIRAMIHGYHLRKTPRVLRRILARSWIHRAWLYGRRAPVSNPMTVTQEFAHKWKMRIYRRAFDHGFIGYRTPRLLRRLIAGTAVHRHWLRGTLTHCVHPNGQCEASCGRLLPFNAFCRN
jgi:hypothetical protein